MNSTLAQVQLMSYDETDNSIIMTLKLEEYSAEGLTSCYDESRPAEIYMPKRNIIIGIPFCNSVKVEQMVKKSSTLKVIPRVNPAVIIKDSVLEYQVLNPEYLNVQENDLITVNGFLWIGNIYCISLDIQQCKYDYIHRTFTQINEMDIIINLENIYTDFSAISHGSIYDNMILNHKEAIKYSVDYPLEKNISEEWIDYEKDYIKIKTAKEGIYRIGYEDLIKLHLNSIDPSKINIYKKGNKIPVYIYGEDDQTFDPGDYVEFYGERNMGRNHRDISVYNEPYNEYLDRYSDTTVYWLSWNDTEQCRVKQIDGCQLHSSDTLKYYTELLHIEKDNWFDYSTDQLVRREMPYWIENKTWGWHGISPGLTNYEFVAHNIYPNITAKIYIKLQSYASSILNNSHSLGIGINGSEVQQQGMMGKYEQRVLSASFNSNEFLEGKNNLRLFSYPTDSDVNTLFMDWYEVEHPRELRLTNDSLSFSFNYLESPSLKTILLSNVKVQDLLMWKKGNDFVRFSELNYQEDTFTFTDTVSLKDKYVIIRGNNYLTPELSPSRRIRDLRNPSVQADYILITNKEFLETASEYVNFIESSYNIKTAVVDIEEIYDVYNYGFMNPETIREFLQYSFHNWTKPSPEYVFIVGDGTYDYHRNKEINLGSPMVKNIVPSFGAPVSDNWFVIWDTTGACIPMMKIGRIPVKTVEEFEYYFKKHREFLSDSYSDWNKRFIFFSGGMGNNQDELNELKHVNDHIKEYVEGFPVAGYGVHFYKTIDPRSDYGPYTSQQIKSTIDSGAVFISYLGHSGTQTWDNGIVDDQQLSNKRNKHPLITDFGCSTGKFAEPDIISFAELFINRGDAIAYLGNSSLGFHSTSTTFPLIFYKIILQDSVYRISEAHKRAKIELLKNYGTSAVYQLFSLSNTYFGDPLISLPIPNKPDLYLNPSLISSPEYPVSDDMDSLKIDVSIFNFGSGLIDSVFIYISDIYNDSIFYNYYRLHFPGYKTNFSAGIPVKGRNGEHRISIKIDPDNRIEEIYENNNEVNFSVNVSNSDLRLLDPHLFETAGDYIEIISPAYLTNENYILEYSFNEDFKDAKHIKNAIGIFSSTLSLKDLGSGTRIWVRAKIEGQRSYCFTKSIYVNSDYNCLYNDSISFRSLTLENSIVEDNSIKVKEIFTNFSVISAGFHDGKTAVISRDGQTYVPGGNTIGHHVCVFREDTHEFVDYKRFNLMGEIQTGGDYYRFLDTLSSDYLILIGVCDEGRVPEYLKRKLHEFGSIYIDSLRFRSSWAFMGRYGMPRGSVPEKYSHPFEGKAVIDTLIKKPVSESWVSTSLIGPAGKWEKIFLNLDSSQSGFYPGWVRMSGRDSSRDSIINLWENTGSGIGSLNAAEYPHIQVRVGLSTGGEPLSFNTLGIKYKLPPELVVTRRGARLSRDTLEYGEELMFNLGIYNAGETSSGEFLVNVEVKGENHTDTILQKHIPSIEPKNVFESEFIIKCMFPGSKILLVNVDPASQVDEIYEDNNILQIPFFVKKDSRAPEIKITCDGIEVWDGSYISGNPDLNITVSDLSYSSVISDPSSIRIWVDDRFISPDEIKYIFKYNTITAGLTPQFGEGEHVIKVIAADGENNCEEVNLCVNVSGGTNLLSVYNYPNPFSIDTWFTFILTDIPDELQIKIYTIAGRLIRKVLVNPIELRRDFNRVYWDGRDEDGETIANGIYFYKIIHKKNEKVGSISGKIAVVR